MRSFGQAAFSLQQAMSVSACNAGFQRRLNVLNQGWEFMRTIDLAREVGLSAQQVRNYEASGLLPLAERDANGFRRYTERHLAALRTVRAMMTAGYDGVGILAIMRAAHEGEIDAALALVDARHASLDRQRRQIELTQAAIGALHQGRSKSSGVRRSGSLTIGEAAKAVGVRPSALRFWEQEGLINPDRDEHSGYRQYDAREMRRLDVVVLLRRANYRFEAIRSVLDELSAGKPESSLRAVDQRRREIAAASRACARSTALLWGYLAEAG